MTSKSGQVAELMSEVRSTLSQQLEALEKVSQTGTDCFVGSNV